jgi:hypothetical protein
VTPYFSELGNNFWLNYYFYLLSIGSNFFSVPDLKKDFFLFSEIYGCKKVSKKLFTSSSFLLLLEGSGIGVGIGADSIVGAMAFGFFQISRTFLRSCMIP